MEKLKLIKTDNRRKRKEEASQSQEVDTGVKCPEFS